MRRLLVFLATSLLGLASLPPGFAAEPDLRPICEPGQVLGEPAAAVADLLARLADPAEAAGRCDVVTALAQMADGGDAIAAIALGDAFAQGKFLARDSDRALDFYLLASDLGDASGLMRAGDLYGDGSSTPNPATANAYYADALAAGELEAAVPLGEFMVRSGNGEQALDYFRQAADGGVADAISHMAALYETRALGSPDSMKAEALYRDAMAAGDETAAVGLARLVAARGSEDDAIDILTAAGDGGNALALEALADLYRDDARPTPDVAKVAELYARAAKLGLPSAALKLGDIWRDAAKPDIPAAVAAYRQVPDEGQLRIGDILRDGVGTATDVDAAIAAYSSAFAAGSDVAAVRIGNLYLEGKLVAPSIEKAAQYLQHVPESIPADRLAAVGQALLAGRYGEGSTRRALGLLERAIANGDTTAATHLGEMYFKGEGVPRDLAAAERYFLQSPDGIPVSALMVLAKAHQDGEGMEADPARAGELYELALVAGVPDAAMRLGEANDKPGTTDRAIGYFVRAAELGVSDAYLRLGALYSGKNGASVDAAAAVAAYQAAVGAGKLDAATKLGDIFFDGTLVPRDLAAAERAYELSPTGVPARAWRDLGLYYRGTDGAPADGKKAVAYLERAFGAGDLQAATALGEIYAEGHLASSDPDKADRYFAKSNAPVPPESSFALGEAYRTGDNVAANGEKAVHHLEAALAGGRTPAALSLGQMYLEGELVAADPATALRYLEPVLKEVPDIWRIAIGDIYRDGTAGLPNGSAAEQQYGIALAGNVAGAGERLADLLFDSGLVPPDIGRAAELWEATTGGVPARALLKVADYYRDRGDAPDKAINYYQAALANGDGHAAGRLGEIFYDGALVPRDLQQAERYYMASGAGVPADKLLTFATAFETGDGIVQNGPRAAEYYEAALSAGQDAALLPLGQLYYAGSLVPKNLLRAADLLDRAGPGRPAAQLRSLAEAFLSGTGVPADPARGAAYLERALGAGDTAVLAPLGDLYLRGEGVARNLATAGHYLLGAAREGETQPLFSLIEAHLGGSLSGGSAAQGKDLLRQAISAGIPGASLRLSEVLIADADPAGGIAVLEAALANGDMEAGKRLLTHYLDGVAGMEPQVSEAGRVLALVTPALDAQEAAYAAVVVSARIPGTAGALERMADNFGLLEPARQSQALLTLKRGNDNVYVYLLQSILVARGHLDAAPSGQLTGPTIRALLTLCRDFDSEATCAAAPMSDASAVAIAAGLASGVSR